MLRLPRHKIIFLIPFIIFTGCSLTKNENEISAHAKFTPIGMEIIDIGFKIYNKQVIGEDNEKISDIPVPSDSDVLEIRKDDVQIKQGDKKITNKKKPTKSKPSPLVPGGILATIISFFRRKKDENDVQIHGVFSSDINDFNNFVRVLGG